MLELEQNKVENKLVSGCIVDYFTFSTKFYNPLQVIEFLGLDSPDIHFEPCRGKWNYSDGVYYRSIKILYNGNTEEMKDFVTVEMTGEGCRTFEDFGAGCWSDLFQMFLDGDISITRFDYALDDHDDYLDLDLLIDSTEKRAESGGFLHWVSDYRSYKVSYSADSKGCKGRTLYWGSNKSENFFRIYDKALQQKDRVSHWVRMELQLRGKHAEAFVRMAHSEYYNGDMALLFSEYLAKKVRFVQQAEDATDTNNRRWENMPFWDKLLDGVAKAAPFIFPGIDHSVDKVVNYVTKNCCQLLVTALSVMPLDALLDNMARHRKYKPLKPVYANMLEEHRDELLDYDPNEWERMWMRANLRTVDVTQASEYQADESPRKTEKLKALPIAVRSNSVKFQEKVLATLELKEKLDEQEQKAFDEFFPDYVQFPIPVPNPYL